MLASAAAAVLTPLVSSYIAKQRELLRPRGRALCPQSKAAIQIYFSDVDVDAVRTVTGDPLPVAEPPFAGMLRRLGFDFPSSTAVSAITLVDLIACREPMGASLLFHELVHVVQFRVLGLEAFAREYVHGFLTSRRYEGIPLEICAFDLERRFSIGERGFHVESEVKDWAVG